MSYLNTARTLGAVYARQVFKKEAQGGLLRGARGLLERGTKAWQGLSPATQSAIPQMAAGAGIGGVGGAISGDDYSLGRILGGAALGGAMGPLAFHAGSKGMARLRGAGKAAPEAAGIAPAAKAAPEAAGVAPAAKAAPEAAAAPVSSADWVATAPKEQIAQFNTLLQNNPTQAMQMMQNPTQFTEWLRGSGLL